ncbi:MAG TPA: cation transporting ATPase C-terminal domain-containing protein [Candidatus Binatia bacterium]|nr:cation transporting ATPase C-terminal domain-containing protein [Candidatus Binatia bacterium]
MILGGLALLGAVLYVPSLRSVFRFAALHPDDLAICFSAGIVCFLLVDLIKRWSRKHLERR